MVNLFGFAKFGCGVCLCFSFLLMDVFNQIGGISNSIVELDYIELFLQVCHITYKSLGKSIHRIYVLLQGFFILRGISN